MTGFRWAAGILTVGLVGCGEPVTEASKRGEAAAVAVAAAPAPVPAPAPRAVANLLTAQGKAAGAATATTAADGVSLALRLEGLPPGELGVHLHMIGQCQAPTFESAGDHLNPANAKHGLESPQGPHLGDLPNLTVDATGRARLDFALRGAGLAGVLDTDGSAIVVHAARDDQKTDPAGDSGDRIACGVFAAG